MKAFKDRLQADMERLGLKEPTPMARTTANPAPPKLTVVAAEDDDGPPTDADIKAVKDDVGADKKGGAAAATRALQDSLVFFIDQYGALRLEVHRSSGRTDCPHADSEDAADYIRSKLQSALGAGKTVTQGAVDAVIQGGRANARAEQLRRQVHMRAANDGGEVVIDTANNSGERIRVSASGYRVEAQGTTLFHRGSGIGVLPQPTQVTAQQGYEILSKFASAHGVRCGDIPVYAIVLTEYLRPGTPHPILELVGPAGARKSTMARATVSIFDPTQNGEIPSTGINEPDVMAAASNRYALHADNVSKLSADNQDLTCRISTGGELSARRLYSQRETESIHVQRPQVYTSITSIFTRSDARSRTQTIALTPPRTGYKSESDVRREFKDGHPDLLGAVCALLSVGLGNLAAVKAQRHYSHRMADFEQLGEAVHQALGQKAGWFGEILAARRQADATVIAEGDLVLVGVLKVLDKWEADTKLRHASKPTGRAIARDGVCVWEDSGTRFTVATTTRWLQAVCQAMPFDQREQPPTSERALKHAIDHRTPTLEALGLRVQAAKANDRNAIVFSRKVAQ